MLGFEVAESFVSRNLCSQLEGINCQSIKRENEYKTWLSKWLIGKLKRKLLKVKIGLKAQKIFA